MKWKVVSPQYIYILYVCSSNATLKWQSTNKKIHQRSWRRSFVFSWKSVKEMQFVRFCDSMILWTRSSSSHHENDFWTQMRFPNDELQQTSVSFRGSVVDDSWRSGVFEMSQIDPISTLDCSDCSRKCVLTIHSSVMYVNTVPNWMDIEADIKRW